MSSFISKITNVMFPKLDLMQMQKRGLHVGKNTYIGTPSWIDHNFCYLISIGDNCIIAPNVQILAHDSSTEIPLSLERVGRVIIGSRTYIGVQSIILPNVRIGNDVIIGAGSIVTTEIPSNSVAAGNPAKIIMPISEFKEKHRKNAVGRSIPKNGKPFEAQEDKLARAKLGKLIDEGSCYV